MLVEKGCLTVAAAVGDVAETHAKHDENFQQLEEQDITQHLLVIRRTVARKDKHRAGHASNEFAFH